jgi:hypothetical protein
MAESDPKETVVGLEGALAADLVARPYVATMSVYPARGRLLLGTAASARSARR